MTNTHFACFSQTLASFPELGLTFVSESISFLALHSVHMPLGKLHLNVQV